MVTVSGVLLSVFLLAIVSHAWSASGTESSSASSSLSSSSLISPNNGRGGGGRFVAENESLLELVLAENYTMLDPEIFPQSLRALQERGAHRCWHKHSTFLQHLLGVHNILRLWGQGEIVGRVGLFHSAYSNSYVNLALFDRETERETMKLLIGNDAEQLVHLFCIIDRQSVVVHTLLKLGHIPQQGLYVPHLRNPSEQVYLSPETLRILVVFTMADYADQYFGWQDQLWGGGGYQGSMIIPDQDYPEKHKPNVLWPGISKPGLWMSYISQLGQLLSRTTTVCLDSQFTTGTTENLSSWNPNIPPPILNHCTALILVEDDAQAIDLYWKVITGQVPEDRVMDTLTSCLSKNPWVFEPYVLLAQCYLHQKQFDSALDMAQRALELQKQWGTAWDKRMSFPAWVAWTRVLLQRAQNQLSWPNNAWGVNNLGLVR